MANPPGLSDPPYTIYYNNSVLWKGWSAVKRLLYLSLLAVLLPGCSGSPPPPGLPPVFSITCQLEAFQGEGLTSRTRFTAVQTGQGFYYADSAGDCYLFLLEGLGTYTLYIQGPSGPLLPNQGAHFSGEALAGFQETFLPLGLLRPDTVGLRDAGTATVAGRPCQIYAGTLETSSNCSYWQFCCLDQETGLALFRTAQYRTWDGQVFTYRLRCMSIALQGAELPLQSIR